MLILVRDSYLLGLKGLLKVETLKGISLGVCNEETHATMVYRLDSSRPFRQLEWPLGSSIRGSTQPSKSFVTV